MCAMSYREYSDQISLSLWMTKSSTGVPPAWRHPASGLFFLQVALSWCFCFTSPVASVTITFASFTRRSAGHRVQSLSDCAMVHPWARERPNVSTSHRSQLSRALPRPSPTRHLLDPSDLRERPCVCPPGAQRSHWQLQAAILVSLRFTSVLEFGRRMPSTETTGLRRTCHPR